MGGFFVRRPIVAMVIAIVTIILGIVSLTGIPVEQYPGITPPQVVVRANYPGANAVNVEQAVATPLEQEINGVENMLYMQSTSSGDGKMDIRVYFEVGTDSDMNTVFVQNRVSATVARLPEEVTRRGVTTEKSLPNILMAILLTDENDRYDGVFLGNYAVLNIQDILARIKGIGRVLIIGSGDYSMRIWIRPDRLARMGITVPEIMAAVREQSTIVPGGKLGGEPAPEGNEFTYTVNLPERLQTSEEFGEIVIRTQEDGSLVKIKDVARVELGSELYDAFGRLNGKEAVVIALYQAPGTNAVEVARQIKDTMDELSKDFPDGVRYDVGLDTTLAITEGLREIITTLIIALVLVVLVVFLFIQDFRATLIPTIAIPVSLVGTFIVFPLIGFSVNVLSLLGLVLAIGIVVDDAIVVVEAVQVNMEGGMDPKSATIKAMKQVAAPIIATTLVLVAVFLPVAAMGGITGRLYQQFAITIAVSVCFSSINALTLSPALCSVLLRPPEPGDKRQGWFFRLFNRAFDRSADTYMSFTRVLTRKTVLGLVFTGIIVLCIGGVSKLLPGAFIPEEDMGYLFVNVQLPDAASLQRTDAVCREVEEIVRSHEEVEYLTSAVGFGMLAGGLQPNTASMFVSLNDWGDRNKTADEIVRMLNVEFNTRIKAAQVFAFGPPAIPGLGNGSGFSLMIQDRGGNTPDYLANHAMAFMRNAMAREEIRSVFSTFSASVPQRRMNIDREKALKAGIPLSSIYSTVGAFLGGAYINDFNRFGRLYRTFIQAEPEYRQDASQISFFYVRNAKGESVPIAPFITVTESTGPDYTNRYNLYRAVEISGAAAPGFSSAQALDALEEVARETLPDDMGFEWSGMSYQERIASGTGNIVFVFSLLFVFLILAAQYESWSLPFSILLGTPFAIFGALLFLYLGRFLSPSYENNIFTQIAMIMLIAMAAKNAILIVEYAKVNFDNGSDLLNAALDAAKTRFRPILMTAFSFILGVMPLVFATGAGAEARKVMGMSLFGGMVVATIIGVFLYPLFFLLIGKLARYEKKRAALQHEAGNGTDDDS